MVAREGAAAAAASQTAPAAEAEAAAAAAEAEAAAAAAEAAAGEEVEVIAALGGGGGAPIIACEGQCMLIDEPPPPPPSECFSNDDCDALGEGYLCVEEPGCDPAADFCPSSCQLVEDCIQVITPAVNPETGSCVEFATPCDVPDDWELVSSCDTDDNP